jgi:hypothetical protein
MEIIFGSKEFSNARWWRWSDAPGFEFLIFIRACLPVFIEVFDFRRIEIILLVGVCEIFIHVVLMRPKSTTIKR